MEILRSCTEPSLWAWGNYLVAMLMTLGLGHTATESVKILHCPHNIVRTAHPIITKLGDHIPLVMLLAWLNLDSVEDFCYWFCCFQNFWIYFIPVKHFIGHILEMASLIDMKRKGSASIVCCVNCVTLNFDLTHALDYGFSRPYFGNYHISVCVISYMKWRLMHSQGDVSNVGISCLAFSPLTPSRPSDTYMHQ